jgi:hypothetical protein
MLSIEENDNNEKIIKKEKSTRRNIEKFTRIINIILLITNIIIVTVSFIYINFIYPKERETLINEPRDTNYLIRIISKEELLENREKYGNTPESKKIYNDILRIIYEKETEKAKLKKLTS